MHLDCGAPITANVAKRMGMTNADELRMFEISRSPGKTRIDAWICFEVNEFEPKFKILR